MRKMCNEGEGCELKVCDTSFRAVWPRMLPAKVLPREAPAEAPLT